MRRHVSAFCVAIWVACAAGPVMAGEKEEAKQLFEAGLTLMRADDFAGASAKFELSIARYPTQPSLFNLANCYRALQRYSEALAMMERLKRDFGDKLKPAIKESIERQSLEIQLLVASLTVEMEPADATLKIDGKEVGTGPKLGPLLLQPGEHDLEASRPDRRSQRRSLKLDPGTSRTERFALEIAAGLLGLRANLDGASVFVDGQLIGTTPLVAPVSLPVGKHVLNLRAAEHEDIEHTLDVRADERQILDVVLSAKLVPMVVPQPVPAPPPALEVASVEAAKPKSRMLKVVTWSAAVGAVAAGAVAGTFLVILSGQNRDFQKHNDLYAQYGRAQDDAQRRSLTDEMRRSSGIVIGCGIAAGALAVTAAVAYFLDHRASADHGKPSLALSPAGLGVRF